MSISMTHFHLLKGFFSTFFKCYGASGKNLQKIKQVAIENYFNMKFDNHFIIQILVDEFYIFYNFSSSF